MFLLSSLVIGPSFISISSQVLELRQFPFIKDWPEIRNQKYPCKSFAQYVETGASYRYLFLQLQKSIFSPIFNISKPSTSMQKKVCCGNTPILFFIAKPVNRFKICKSLPCFTSVWFQFLCHCFSHFSWGKNPTVQLFFLDKL